jgi:hypothetical protein
MISDHASDVRSHTRGWVDLEDLPWLLGDVLSDEDVRFT